jgi:hypothetical protein
MLGIEYPSVQLEHVIDAWQEMGLISGANPLSWADIGAYVQLSGVYLDARECSTIIDMSKSYLYQLRNTDPKEIAPWQSEQSRPNNLAEKLRQRAGRKK